MYTHTHTHTCIHTFTHTYIHQAKLKVYTQSLSNDVHNPLVARRTSVAPPPELLVRTGGMQLCVRMAPNTYDPRYVCVYVCMYACMYACVIYIYILCMLYIYAYAWHLIHMTPGMCVCMYVCMHECMHVSYICIVYVIYIYIYTCVCTYIYI